MENAVALARGSGALPSPSQPSPSLSDRMQTWRLSDGVALHEGRLGVGEELHGHYLLEVADREESENEVCHP